MLSDAGSVTKITRTRCLHCLGRLRIATDPQTDARALTDTRSLSRQHGLTLYDAAYLELALRRNFPLASRDADLLAAAKSQGVELIAA